MWSNTKFSKLEQYKSGMVVRRITNEILGINSPNLSHLKFPDRLYCCSGSLDGCLASKVKATFVCQWGTNHCCSGTRLHLSHVIWQLLSIKFSASTEPFLSSATIVLVVIRSLRQLITYNKNNLNASRFKNRPSIFKSFSQAPLTDGKMCFKIQEGSESLHN